MGNIAEGRGDEGAPSQNDVGVDGDREGWGGSLGA